MDTRTRKQAHEHAHAQKNKRLPTWSEDARCGSNRRASRTAAVAAAMLRAAAGPARASTSATGLYSLQRGQEHMHTFRACNHLSMASGSSIFWMCAACA